MLTEDWMIPQEKNGAVARALEAAFGVKTCDDIRLLKGGAGKRSDLIFCMIVKGSPYLLRIVKRTNDPACHFTCMKIAAEGGLAPHVWFSSVEDGVCITDFVEAEPVSRKEALVRMAGVLRKLHALPPFPGRADHLNTSCTFLLNKGPALDELVRSFQSADLVPKKEGERFLSRYTELAAAYERNSSDMVSCHNDLVKRDNVLFNGDRVWLVDWEAAFLNDRYADLAGGCELRANTDEEETRFLERYFGRLPDELERARFFLMRQVAHMFYAIANLLMGAASKPANWSEPVPGFEQFHERIWAGEINPWDKEMKTIYGQVHWKRLQENMELPRFDEAVRTVLEPRA